MEGAVPDPKKLVIACSDLDVPLKMKGPVGAYLNEIVEETIKMATYFMTTQPGLLEKFANHEKPLISALAALDHHWEYEVTSRFDSPHCSTIFIKGRYGRSLVLHVKIGKGEYSLRHLRH